MHPVVLGRHRVDVALQALVHERRVGLDVVGREVLPRRQHLDLVAARRELGHHRHHLGLAQPREARQRGHGGRLHAVEGHEDGLVAPEVHVGQQVQQAALAQPREDGLDAVHPVERRHVAEARAAFADPGVDHRVALGRVDRGRRARRVHGERGGRGIEAVEVRREQDHRRVAFGDLADFRGRTDDLQPALHHLLGRMPEPAAVQPRLRDEDEGLARDGAALGLRFPGEAQGQVPVDHAPPRHGDGVQQAAEDPAEAAHERQGQRGQHPHEADTESGAEAHGAAPPAALATTAGSPRGSL
ncbi:hypothetical protein D3C87_1131740 [compost metagenome]